MDGPVFSIETLPPFEAGTTGWARQVPEANVVACQMPETRSIEAPWGILWGKAGLHYHQVSTLGNEEGRIDEFPNDQFIDDYDVIRELHYGDDARGDRLFDLYGRSVKVVLAYKATPIIVHGRIAQFCLFKSSESKGEKVHSCPPGSVIVSNNARTRTWSIGPEDFRRLYGNVIHAGLPA